MCAGVWRIDGGGGEQPPANNRFGNPDVTARTEVPLFFLPALRRTSALQELKNRI